MVRTANFSKYKKVATQDLEVRFVCLQMLSGLCILPTSVTI
jgi:hypothetical protein